ncbi:MAG: single-stranded-DNA-specific exonuclease RecJ [Gammaproteobacteria bacterium]|nr:single-stranded-DNA-specific exonuclease RecJ [Gammaproteobacteria bacterium]
MDDVRVRPVVVRPVPAIGNSIDVHPVLQRIYAARGVTQVEDLDYALRGLLPVSTLTGVDEAVELIADHAEKHITIIGDFDADGATSTALVIRCLREFGISNVDYLVPNRFKFGYGLTPEIVRVAAERSPDLLITVDNGVSSIEGVKEAHAFNMKVLITDHHLPGSELPDADAMVNPNLEDNDFGSPHLAGVGVAFYLMAALGRELESRGQKGASKVPAKYLDLVALGTVADVVRLDHNNRILVEQGIKRIRAGRAVPGIAALFNQARRSVSRAVSIDLGFVVGPRLNAAGRLEDMSVGIECLLTDDPAVAARIASMLDEINKERKTIESKMRQQAFAYVDAMDSTNLPSCVCLFDKDWHQGVVGLIASRVRERCDRPVFAFAREEEGVLKGSARSVPGVHIRDLLESISSSAPGLIPRFGGHAMAAGLNLGEQDFDRFSALAAAKLNEMYPDADFSGAILTDGNLPESALNLKFARALREAGPWGAGFPEPVFSGDFSIDDQRTVGESHLKMRVRPAVGGNAVDAIAFNQAGPAYRGTVQLTYRLDVNEFRGIESPQLIVEQIVNISGMP